MSTAVLAPGTLADRILPRTWVTNTALIAGGVLLVALLARISVPMWPVPITGQTLGVLLVGAALGTWRGAVTTTSYALLGLAGLPVFAGGGGPLYFLSPSFGFILGFIPAAALAGWFAEHRWDRRSARAVLAFLAASVVPFVVGVPYLGLILGTLGAPNDLAMLWSSGVAPFLVGGLVKAAIASVLLPVAWRAVRRIDKHTER